GAARRPAGIAGGEVRRRRPARHADDRRRRQDARRRSGRGEGPPQRRATQGRHRRRRHRAQLTQVEAVLFDWGGTLTTFHTVDMIDAWRVAAEVLAPDRVDEVSQALLTAEREV